MTEHTPPDIRDDTIITFDQVTKCYDRHSGQGNTLRNMLSRRPPGQREVFTAVDAVSFSVPAGASVALLGGNGAGKSTLLKLLTRVTLPTQGRVRVRGRLMCLLEVGAGFHHDLSGMENIILSGALLGVPPHEVSAAMDDIIAFSGLGAVIHEPVRTYSSGMLLRLAFSTGVFLNTDILAIDEALAVGDAAFRARCLAKLKDLNARGRTLFLVSHDAAQLRAVCRTGLVMHRGRLVMHGDIDDAIYLHKQLLEKQP